MPRGTVYDKVMSNLEEIKARGGPYRRGLRGRHPGGHARRHHFTFPRSRIFAAGITVVPLQLLAYEIALLRGCDIDKPQSSPRVSPWNNPKWEASHAASRFSRTVAFNGWSRSA